MLKSSKIEAIQVLLEHDAGLQVISLPEPSSLVCMIGVEVTEAECRVLSVLTPPQPVQPEPGFSDQLELCRSCGSDDLISDPHGGPNWICADCGAEVS